MKAIIELPMTKTAAEDAIKALNDEHPTSDRVITTLKASTKGLEIIINSRDIGSMRAALNTTLKLYKVHSEVKNNVK